MRAELAWPRAIGAPLDAKQSWASQCEACTAQGVGVAPRRELAKGSRLALPTSNVGNATCQYQAQSQDSGWRAVSISWTIW